MCCIIFGDQYPSLILRSAQCISYFTWYLIPWKQICGHANHMPSKTKLQNHSNDKEADRTGEIQIKQIQKVTYMEQQKSHWIYNPTARFHCLKSSSLYSDRLATKQLNDPVIHWFALWNMTNTSVLPYHLTCEAFVW